MVCPFGLGLGSLYRMSFLLQVKLITQCYSGNPRTFVPY